MNSYPFTTRAAAQAFAEESSKSPLIGLPLIVDCGYAFQVLLFDRGAA